MLGCDFVATFSEVLNQITTSNEKLNGIWEENEKEISEFIRSTKQNKEVDELVYNKYELMLSAELVFYSYNRKFSRR